MRFYAVDRVGRLQDARLGVGRSFFLVRVDFLDFRRHRRQTEGLKGQIPERAVGNDDQLREDNIEAVGVDVLRSEHNFTQFRALRFPMRFRKIGGRDLPRPFGKADRSKERRDRARNLPRSADAPRVKVVFADHKAVRLSFRVDERKNSRVRRHSFLDLFDFIDGREYVRNAHAARGNKAHNRFLLNGHDRESFKERYFPIFNFGIGRNGRERIEPVHDRFRIVCQFLEVRELKEERLTRVANRRGRKLFVRHENIAQRKEPSSKGLRSEEAFAPHAFGDFKRLVFEIAVDENTEPAFVRRRRRDHLNRERVGRPDRPVDDRRFAEQIFV